MAVTYRSVPDLPADRVRIGSDGSVQVWHSGWKRWRTLMPRIKNRMKFVCFVLNGRQITRSLGRLVCRAFHGPKPLGHTSFRFPDPDPANCRADNIRWAPAGAAKIGCTENRGSFCHRRPNSRGAANGSAVMTEADVVTARRLKSEGLSHAAIADRLGYNANTIASAVSGRKWAHLPGANKGHPCSVRGTANCNAKLDDERVRLIRALARDGQAKKAIARRMGLSTSTVNQVIRRATWSHVPDDPQAAIEGGGLPH